MLFFFYGTFKAILGNARAPLTWSLSLRQACMSNSSTTRAVSESHRRHRTISQLKGNPSCATPPGLEPGIPWFVVRCLIHWATGPLSRVGNAPSPAADRYLLAQYFELFFLRTDKNEMMSSNIANASICLFPWALDTWRRSSAVIGFEFSTR